MQAQSDFSGVHRATIADLCNDLSQLLQCAVTAEYGSTECGRFHDASLCVGSLPPGAWGRPGPLTSILAGPHGFAVIAADGAPVLEGVTLDDAIHAATPEAARAYSRMVEGAVG